MENYKLLDFTFWLSMNYQELNYIIFFPEHPKPNCIFVLYIKNPCFIASQRISYDSKMIPKCYNIHFLML